ncbi:hypothetical protein KC723_03555 [Candidatus Kaiserbacteria bacterium]|nr:hypothetical protein [Candidatus Kaiserbacteria bacterium]
MIDYVYIGESPVDEDCLPSDDSRSAAECRIYARQLRRQFPNARIRVKREPGGWGGYSTVVAEYDDSIPEEMKAAFDVEGESPMNWDLQAKFELSELLSVQEFNERFSSYESA